MFGSMAGVGGAAVGAGGCTCSGGGAIAGSIADGAANVGANEGKPCIFFFGFLEFPRVS